MMSCGAGGKPDIGLLRGNCRPAIFSLSADSLRTGNGAACSDGRRRKSHKYMGHPAETSH
jgi:hypothetical protein